MKQLEHNRSFTEKFVEFFTPLTVPHAKSELFRAQSVIFCIVAGSMADPNEEEIKAAFLQFDGNGDGHIEKKELGKFLKSMGLNVKKKELSNMIKEADKDGDNKIGYDEFKDLVNDALYGDHELREAFNNFDTSGDGFISVTELKGLMESLGGDFSEYDILEMLVVADKDKDGKVSFDEYKHIMGGC